MKQGRRELFDDINITPLTDIFLVLLIIMMVVAPMLSYRGLDMLLAVGAPADAKNAEVKRLWVGIAADGQYKIDGETVAADNLATAIRKGLEQKPEGVVIEADPDATHAALARAIDAAQTAGVPKVSVVEKTADEPAKQPGGKGQKGKRAKGK